MKDIFLNLIANILKNHMNFLMITTFTRKNEIEKFEKLVANFHDKTEYVIHIRNLKQALTLIWLGVSP